MSGDRNSLLCEAIETALVGAGDDATLAAFQKTMLAPSGCVALFTDPRREDAPSPSTPDYAAHVPDATDKAAQHPVVIGPRGYEQDIAGRPL